MPPLPRKKCATCARLVPVRRNGDTREHINYTTGTKCAGSGKAPK